MLKRLELSNFQCHRKTALEFDPGVNVIAGTSDGGKSAILKGLLWLVTNRPQGLGFRSMQAKKGDLVEAKIVLDEHEIIRQRGEQVNEYLMDGKRFVAMKNEVPQEIAAELNLLPVNIQTQFQPHFLLSASSGDVARTLNESCDLSIIDQTIKRIKAIEQAAKADAKYLAGALEETEQELEKLDWVEDAEVRANALTAELDRTAKKKEQEVSLEKMIAALQQATIEMHILQDLDRAFSFMPVLEKQITKLAKLDADWEKLAAITGKLLDIRKILNSKPESLFEAMPRIEKEISSFLEVTRRSEKLERLVSELEKITTQEEAADSNLARIQAELARFNTCPLCGAAIKIFHKK